MITKYAWGNPYPTGATVKELPVADARMMDARIRVSDEGRRMEIDLAQDDVIYGLGESLHGMNKRGFTYISHNMDEMHHDENIYSLYGSHNFILIDSLGQEKLGLFIDNPAKVTWDLGFTDKDKLVITMEENDYECYVITGKDDLAVIHEFRELIGQSYVAPQWAFGYGQSRWGYKNEEDIRKVVEGHRKNNLPLDAVYMDIDYMQDYEDFTINEERFPDFPAFVQEMKEQNIHLVPTMDAAVKVLPGYSVYDEGVEKGYFCTEENGDIYLTAVWPGTSVLPDFFREDVKQWFGEKYRMFYEAGIDGFWNDMNEPAMFYSLKNLRKVAEELATLPERVETLTMYDLWDVQGKVNSLASNDEDYRSFYHEIDGRRVRHDKVHNLYGYQMIQGTREAMDRIDPDWKPLLFCRSSYIGMHRYAGIWTGDNSSFYRHIDLIMHQLPNLNMCGFLYVGADTGGFGFHTSEPLLMRFMQMSMFTPLMRNHSALGVREQEIYQFKNIDAFRRMLQLRYALIPYLYEAYVKAAIENTMMFTPLGMAYPEDRHARHIEDQLLVGDAIMIAPVTKANAIGRTVYLPEAMTFYRMRSDCDYDREELEAGYHYIEVAIDEVPVFVRRDHFLYLAKPAMSTAQMSEEDFSYLN